MAKISAKMDETRAEARRLPLLPNDKPVRVVIQLIIDLQRQVDIEIAGTPSATGLVQKMNKPVKEFRDQLRGSAPRFIPFEPNSESAGALTVPSIPFLLEEEQDLRHEGIHPVLNLSDVESRARGSVSSSECCLIADTSDSIALSRVSYPEMYHLP